MKLLAKIFFVNIFFIICSRVGSYGQVNLVPNPSFEDTVNCPYQSGDIDKATGWTSLCGSPDFFNICNQYDWGVPKNIFGYQIPASGNGYAGFMTYTNYMTNIREFPACNLITPLSIGTKYYISFKIALSLESVANPTNCASDKTGAMFTMGDTCNSLITNNPPVFTNSIVTDTLNWTRISGSCVADSAYTYLVIGNFFDDVNTDTLKFFDSWWSDFAYYYVDDICVSTDSLYTINYSYIGISESTLNPAISIYPNPTTGKINIVCDKEQHDVSLEIINMVGQTIISIKNINLQQGENYFLDISSLEMGAYILRFNNYQKIIVKN